MTATDREAGRLAALARYHILDTPNQPAFDGLARIAARLFGAPLAAVNIVDGALVWAKGCCGGPLEPLPRAGTLCEQVATSAAPLVAPDLAALPGALPADLRIGGASPRFYVAVPLLTPDGYGIGTICVFDVAPRDGVDGADVAALQDLAALAMSELEFRRQGREAEARAARQAPAAALLAQAADADDVGGVASAALRTLCAAVGAKAGAVVRVAPDGVRLIPLALEAPDATAQAALRGLFQRATANSSGSLSGAALRAGRPISFDLRAGGWASAGGVAHAMGVDAVIACPVALAGERYVFSLGVEGDAARAEELIEPLTATIELLRPVFHRLRSAEEAALLRRAIDASSEGFMLAEAASEDRPEPRIIYANPALLTMTGYALDELMGRSPYLLYPPDEEHRLRDEIAARVPRGETVSTEHVNLRKDGTAFWSATTFAPIADPAGVVTHTVSIRRDVTAAREAAGRVAGSEAAFRSLFDSNPIPMWIFDCETLRFLEVNLAAVESYGWSREQFLAMTMLDIRPAEDAEAARQFVRERRTVRRESGPHRHLDAQGRLREVMAMACQLRHAGREATLVAVWDVTKRLRAEREIRDVQRLARIGAWRCTPGAAAPDWSPEALALFGGDDARARIADEDAAALRAALAEAAAGDGDVEADFRVRRADERMTHLHLLGRRGLDETGRPVVEGYVQDVTEAREAIDGMRRAERLSAIGQLTGGIAHDFNNLLTIALGNIELAEDRTADPDVAAMLARARGAVERGARLTGHMLAFARRQPLAPADVALRPFLTNLLQLVGPTLGETHPLTVSIDDATAAARCDPSQLEASLVNLILNARDATPGGGALRLSVGWAEPRDVNAAGLAAAGRMVAVGVTDDGPGMADAVKERATEPFFTTKPPGKGTGLGLSMAQGFARQSGGELLLRDAPDGGLEAVLLLPAAAGVTGRRPAGGGVAGPLDPLDVLAVEDDPEVREAAAAMLRAIGLAPTCVGSAAEALALLRAGVAFDLLFTDVVLGGPMDGVALAQAACALQPDLAVLLTTGYAEALATDGTREPPYPVLRKPYAPASLQAAASAAMAARRAALTG
jgi:PAS domain S-box-containing protein